MMQTVKAERIDEKKWCHLHGFHVSLLTYMVFKLAKKVHFCNFVMTSAKKSIYVKAICVYSSESSY